VVLVSLSSPVISSRVLSSNSSGLPSEQYGLVSSYYIQGFVQFYFSSAISYILQLSSDITFFQLSNLTKTAVILEYAFLLPFIGFLSVLFKTLSVSTIICHWWQMKEI